MSSKMCKEGKQEQNWESPWQQG